ncbi:MULTISPECIES: glycine cleavage system aminomethyltransferase GcvT [Thiorhodovibrio]|uniref:glycine cleavage system aminomethyltransferase GcvT n=1 Tax=Thiorhodovibrio TaxID=61593 RepID=UPI0019126393|nr:MULTISPECIES: glycine cleavage system aminomethyltransferase GcvT [Thiorhodovibrio]MBK5968280.1 glycine cleavage system protein T [Thiorhodovibrio winogradskyi]WPL13016.1 Aminomethyltransferase [Thiorhodovibrio litoralis]
MAHRTPLFAAHQAAGARMVPFGGWDMPVNYGSQIEEHHAVRRAVGVFDVSHMRAVDISGPRATDFLRYLLANDVARLPTPGEAPDNAPGKALYSCMLNEQGGVIDDLILYKRGTDSYRLVLNAATTDSDLDWIQTQAAPFAPVITRRDDLAMLAVQGPEARATAIPLLPAGLRATLEQLKPFSACEQDELFVARTGYTGEDGFEIILPNDQVADLWQHLLDAGARPCGLGARDTLRLEAGMNLSGQDMGPEVSPLVSGLGWTIAWEPPERDFIGRAALERQRKEPLAQRFVGILLLERGVLRHGQPVIFNDQVAGELTSGGFSPTLERSIGLARVAAAVTDDCQVEIRGRRLAARLVKPPFVRHGEIKIPL